MNEKAALYYHLNEPYAAGLFEQPDKSAFARYSRAARRYWEHCSPHGYDGGRLYPTGGKFNDPYAVLPDYSYTVSVKRELLAQKETQALAWITEEIGRLPGIGSPHTVGGEGYTHSIPNYGRVAREGLDSYEKRTRALPPGDFRDGLLDVLAGIRDFHRRSLLFLKQRGADKALVAALEKVPFQPARDLYEAVVCWNFIYYIDLCDNPGLLDADLMPFHSGEDITELLRAFFNNVDVNSGWSCALGPEYSPLTMQCLRAVKGLRRPSMELRVTGDMPGEVWSAAIDAIKTGGGQPALYNEALYQQALGERFPHIPKEDLLRFNGGGCTETMLAGISNVGSLDAGINLALIFHQSLYDHLARSKGFEAFYLAFLGDARRTIADTLDQVNRNQQARAEYRPQPMRSLLIDDCIDRGLDFNAGGARYTWSVINVAGLINVIDSLLAVRELVYRNAEFTPEIFLGECLQ